MKKIELWGRFPGGRNATLADADILEGTLDRLIQRYGPEAVAQVAVLRTGIMPVDERDPA